MKISIPDRFLHLMTLSALLSGVLQGQAQPTVNAPTPIRPVAKVISMFNSGATYTDRTINSWYAVWSGATGSDYTIIPTSRVVKRYSGLAYAGVEFYDANAINVGGFTALHVDLWTPDANQFGVKLVSFDAGHPEAQVNITPASGTITNNGWVSLDIPLSQFTALNPNLTLTNLQQLLWIDNQVGGIQNGTFYIDNVYFWTTNGIKSSIALGKKVSWTADNVKSYQPQKSADNSIWVNVGGLLSGSAVTSVFEAVPAPYYRIQEISSGAIDSVVNGGFEATGAESTGAANWIAAGGGGAIHAAARSNLDPRSGAYELDLEAQGDGVSGPAAVAFQDGIPISPGPVTLSFHAKGVLKLGGANLQYGIYWFDSANNELAGSGFSSFPSAPGASYTLESINLTAPANTDHAQLQFLLAAGAGTGDHWLLRIDDVSLAKAGTPTTNIVAATVQSGVGLTWSSKAGNTYQVQSRPNLSTPWSVFSASVTGTGTNTAADGLTSSNKFYHVFEVD